MRMGRSVQTFQLPRGWVIVASGAVPAGGEGWGGEGVMAFCLMIDFEFLMLSW